MRIFKTRVAIRVNSQEQSFEVYSILTELGYRWVGTLSYSPFVFNEKYPYIVTDSFRNDIFTWATNINKSIDKNIYTIEHYNLDLFKALAAMSEGEDFYKGEAIIRNDLSSPSQNMYEDNLYIFDSITKYGNIKVENNNNTFKSFKFRKATLEEIINHFSQKETMKEISHYITSTDLPGVEKGTVLKGSKIEGKWYIPNTSYRFTDEAVQDIKWFTPVYKEEVKKKEMIFNGEEITIYKDKVKTPWGYFTKENVIAIKNQFMVGNYINNYPVEVTAIKIGCKENGQVITFNEITNILNVMNNL